MNDKTVRELYDDALVASNAAGFAFIPVAQVIDQQDAEIMQLRAERDALKADIDRRIRADENIRERWKEYAEELKADAERYRKLREMSWYDGPLCVVRDPKQQVKPGTDCPSHDRLDEALDSL